MQMVEVAEGIAGWIISSGVLLWLGKLWLEKQLHRAQKEADARKTERQQRYAIDDEYLHAVGRFLFWTQKGAERLEQETGKSYWNGDLQKAFQEVESAEEKRKELDRKQLAKMNED